MRRTALARRTGLRRDTPAGLAWLRKPRKPLPVESPKRRAERPVRKQVRETTFERAGWRCEAAELVPSVACGGRLECHERTARGTHPGSHLDDTVTVALCERHHEFTHQHPREAEALGLRVRRSE